MPASVSGPMSTLMPIPIQILHHGYHQQRQQLPYPPVYGAASPDFVGRGRVPQACENCKFRKVKCSGACPCERCAGRALRCVYGERKVRGPTKKRREKRDTAVRRVSSSSPVVSFFLFFCRGFLLIFFSCLVLGFVFSGRHSSMPNQPSSHPMSPLPRLCPNLSLFMHPYPRLLPHSLGPDIQCPFHSSLFLPPLLPYRSHSRLHLLYPALSSHHPLPQYLPSSLLQE